MPHPSYPAMGRLVVESSYHPLVVGIPGVTVEINGHPTKVPWGQAPFDLPAGNYVVRVSGRWLGKFGPAQLPVAVYPGQVTTVYYRSPTAHWMRGSIGFTPQETRGATYSWVVLVIIAVVIVGGLLAIGFLT